MPAVSIIVPVYNCAAYLEECLASLLGQSYADIEILCINDGSTDNSLERLEAIARQDARVKIFSQENQGAAIARNNGINYATGDYLLFIDGDDFVSPNLVHSAYSTAVSHQADVVIFRADKYNNETGSFEAAPYLADRNTIPEQSVFNSSDVPEDLFTFTTPAPWNKLFRRDFILSKQIEFQALPNTNDLRFTYTALAEAQRICFVDEVLTHYRFNTGESTQARRGTSPRSFAEALQGLMDQLQQRDLLDRYRTTLAKRTISTSLFILDTARFYSERVAALQAICSGNYPVVDLALNADLTSQNTDWQSQQQGLNYITSAYRHRERARSAAPLLEIKKGSCESEPLVSVVVPVYNTAPYVEQAVSSILAQTLENLEVICIDDGSTDGSLEVLKRLSDTDSRVSVYSQENRGLAYTRSQGVSLARGTFIYFMDSDDELKPSALENLANRASADNLDMLLFDGQSFFDGDDFPPTADIEYFKRAYQRPKAFDDIYTGQELFSLFWQLRIHYVSACLYLIRRSFIQKHGLEFPSGVLHEDNAFSFAALMNAQRVSHTNERYFLRRVRSDSIMTRPVSFEHSYGYFSCAQSMRATCESLADTMTDETKSCALAHIADNMNLSRARFSCLSSEERRSKDGLTVEREAFERMIAMNVEDNERLRNDVFSEVRASRSYRLGHLLLSPVRVFRRILQKLKGNATSKCEC